MMFNFFILLSLALLLLTGAIPFKNEEEKKGVLLLDSTTFPKIVPNADRDVVVLVALKGQIGDYGTDSLRADFFSFSSTMQTSGTAENVLFAQIIVNGAENQLLAERIGVGADFKHPKLFVFPAGSSVPIPYPADSPFHLNTLTPFVVKHTSLSYQQSGTLRLFDDLAVKFMNGDDAVKAATLVSAEQALEDSSEEDKETGKYYIKVMKKITANGPSFLQTEINRQRQVLRDGTKLTKANRRNVENHVNVLFHFAAHANSRDEF